jgi:hypothetical protein
VRHAETLERLARESGRRLGELGVRSGDEAWIRRHAETIASLTEGAPPKRRGAGLLRRWARRVVRAAR